MWLPEGLENTPFTKETKETNFSVKSYEVH